MGNDYLFLLQGGLFAALLAAASRWDIRKRIIPDTLCLCIALTGLLTFSPVKLLGFLAAMPLLLAALFLGGIGGGDIKLVAAAGLALGFHKSMTAVMLGFSALLVFHTIHTLIQKLRIKNTRNAYPLAPFLSFGYLVAYFIF